MEEDQVEGLVLRDSAGHLYVIPREVVEQGRVTDESRATVEAALEDTTGFVFENSAFGLPSSFEVLGPIRLHGGTSKRGFPIPPFASAH